MAKIEIPEFEKAEYLETTTPYEWLYAHRQNRLELKQLTNRMAEMAQAFGIRNFPTLFQEYLVSLKDVGGNTIAGENCTDFDGQEQALWCGSWTANDSGIHGTDRFGTEIVACQHPIMPVRRLVNIDSGLEKMELAYRRGGIWRRHIFDKSTISDARSIIRLSDFGVAVNSDNAKNLVKFLGDVESLNYDRIEEANSVGRLGWIDEYVFSPYAENLIFDGAEDFRDRFESVREHGNYEDWKQACRSIRKTECVVTRIILAASFASVLVKPCGCLPFLVHLWGGSEVGKTVGLMLAASVWANPELGRYIQTFNATGVFKELGATFVNSLPLILDELCLIDGSANNRAKFQQMIYELAEGVGRGRGKKSGGVQKTGTWRNCIISSGENPITDHNTASGAVNRTIEIFCQDIKLFTSNCIGGGKEMARFLQNNYGYAGRDFVTHLQKNGNIEKAVALQDRFTKDVLELGSATDKQSASAALLLAADALAERWIFMDGICLTVSDLAPFLTTKARMDQNKRALEFLYDQIAMNPVHFDPDRAAERSAELWGEMDEQYIYIIKPLFDRLLGDNGFNASSFLGWARQNGFIRIGKDGKSTITHRIRGKVARCVCLSLPVAEIEESSMEDVLPL